ncbi:MAG: anthranilate synthase component I family protein [Candidatus Binatia bacterium]
MGTQEVELAVSPTELLLRCVDEPFAFVLDGGGTASWGSGHALLSFRPCATLHVTPNGEARMWHAGAVQQWHGDPFALLDRFVAEWAPREGADALGGGVIAALSYELRHWVERLPRHPHDDLHLPVLYAAAYDWLLSYSYNDGRYRLASHSRSAPELRCLAGELAARAADGIAQPELVGGPPVVSDFTKDEYVHAVEKSLDYIAAGDVYQVNLAQRFGLRPASFRESCPGLRAPAALFAALQRQHAMPFAAYIDAGEFALVSNSPECFLTRRQQQVETFPIKGTRQRGADPQTDAALARTLRADPKERAEHVMIVDLERNDLGRVCRTGSVRVDAFAEVHTFPSLHHLVSRVAGELRPGVTLADVLRAAFPGGSITGAPKIRAMQIIDELEPVARGFYTGALGFIGGGDNAVFNLAIRTAVASGGRVTYHAGGGIVADSVPTREYDETLLKAQPFFAALRPRAA